MAKRTPRSSGKNDVRDPAYDALISLHAQAGRVGGADPGLIPGFQVLPRGEALRAVAAASAEQIPASSRLGVLGDLARAGFPGRADDEDGYLELAASVDRVRIQNDRPIDAASLLRDLDRAVREKIPFHQHRALRARGWARSDLDLCGVPHERALRDRRGVGRSTQLAGSRPDALQGHDGGRR